MTSMTTIHNCRLYTEPNSNRHDIQVTDGTLKSVRPATDSVKSGDMVIDAGERLVTPGFIDVHIHGAGGMDTLTNSADSNRIIARTLAKLGTTSYLATLVPVPAKVEKSITLIRDTMGSDTPGAQILGIHLEGPYINPVKRGGLFQEAITPPSVESFEKLTAQTGDTLKMMTIAPELDGADEIIRRLRQRRVIVAMGHTNATYGETRRYLSQGIHHITHLYNAMPSLHHREPGPLLAILESEAATVQLICDGRHVDPAMIRWTHRQLTAGRIVGITDGMQAIGLPEGRYQYNGLDYESRDGSAAYLDGTLIGTTLSLSQLVQNYRKYTECSLKEAVHIGTLNPARLLGIDRHKGTLDPGKDADLVIFDDDGSVWKTMVGGEVVYSKTS